MSSASTLLATKLLIPVRRLDLAAKGIVDQVRQELRHGDLVEVANDTDGRVQQQDD